MTTNETLDVEIPVNEEVTQEVAPVKITDEDKKIRLTEKAMIVRLGISFWSARKYDKTASDEIKEINEAKGDAGRFNKLLVSKEAINKIQKVVSKMRLFNYENTLNWGEDGERLLPATNYFEYVAKLDEFKKEFDDAVKDFLNNYEYHINEARTRLGKLFNINEYPTMNEVKSKFNVKTVYFTVPENDFRVAGLTSKEQQELKDSAQNEIKERLDGAVKDVWARIKDQLSKMHERLSDKEKIFKNTLFTNLESLIEILPRLNVVNSKQINDICNEMKTIVSDPDNVRSDDVIRLATAEKIESIMNKYKDFF